MKKTTLLLLGLAALLPATQVNAVSRQFACPPADVFMVPTAAGGLNPYAGYVPPAPQGAVIAPNGYWGELWYVHSTSLDTYLAQFGANSVLQGNLFPSGWANGNTATLDTLAANQAGTSSPTNLHQVQASASRVNNYEFYFQCTYNGINAQYGLLIPAGNLAGPEPYILTQNGDGFQISNEVAPPVLGQSPKPPASGKAVK